MKQTHTYKSVKPGQDDFFQVALALWPIGRKLMYSMKVAALLIYTKIRNLLKELIKGEL